MSGNQYKIPSMSEIENIEKKWFQCCEYFFGLWRKLLRL